MALPQRDKTIEAINQKEEFTNRKEQMMNKFLTILAAVAIGMCAGCAVFRGEDPRVEVDNAVVVVTAGRTLREAVVQAATHRHWNVQELENGELRCRIVQRSNRVTIDVVITGETTYAIRFVESNIPNRKYNQWINNLQREIAKWAAR